MGVKGLPFIVSEIVISEGSLRHQRRSVKVSIRFGSAQISYRRIILISVKYTTWKEMIKKKAGKDETGTGHTANYNKQKKKRSQIIY